MKVKYLIFIMLFPLISIANTTIYGPFQLTESKNNDDLTVVGSTNLFSVERKDITVTGPLEFNQLKVSNLVVTGPVKGKKLEAKELDIIGPVKLQQAQINKLIITSESLILIDSVVQEIVFNEVLEDVEIKLENSTVVNKLDLRKIKGKIKISNPENVKGQIFNH